MKKIHHHLAPTLIPHVFLDVHADGTVTAAVDGVPLDPPPAGPWRRSSLGQIIDLATGGRAAPARVEVREADGTEFTDFITRRSPHHTHEVGAIDEETTCTDGQPGFAAIEESGFMPEEEVAVAVIVGQTEAGRSGMVQALLNPARLGSGEVILLGRISGTLAIRRLR
jgi:hypothetical protein